MSKDGLKRALGLKLSRLAGRPASGRSLGGEPIDPGPPEVDLTSAQPVAASVDRFVREAWRLALGRAPSDAELAYLAGRLAAGESPMDFLLQLVDCPEAVARQAIQDAVGRPASVLSLGGEPIDPGPLEPDLTGAQPAALSAGRFVREAWRLALGRAPSDAELAYLAGRLAAGESPMDFLLELVDCPEAVARQARQDAATPLFVPPGHYYSPVVDPSDLRSRWPGDRRKHELAGIDIDFTAMGAMFERLMAHQGGLDFPDREAETHRYYLGNGLYGVGDAVILACMIRHFRPRRIIEVGSGFSSAVILDTLDRTPDLETACTFIEPYTERLDALLRPADPDRVTIIRSGIQTVPLETFKVLEAGDILFLDTTHISKTGSDVNHEVFEVLPILASGVVVHFHDIFAGFEYPDEWIFKENRSWNEQYLLRAFLMFNRQFEILYANDAFVNERSDLIRSLCPRILENGGGGFWLQRR